MGQDGPSKVREEVRWMARFVIPRIAHCSQGHAQVLGMTETCPGGRGPGNPARRESREACRAKDDRFRDA